MFHLVGADMTLFLVLFCEILGSIDWLKSISIGYTLWKKSKKNLNFSMKQTKEIGIKAGIKVKAGRRKLYLVKISNQAVLKRKIS